MRVLGGPSAVASFWRGAGLDVSTPGASFGAPAPASISSCGPDAPRPLSFTRSFSEKAARRTSNAGHLVQGSGRWHSVQIAPPRAPSSLARALVARVEPPTALQHMHRHPYFAHEAEQTVGADHHKLVDDLSKRKDALVGNYIFIVLVRRRLGTLTASATLHATVAATTGRRPSALSPSSLCLHLKLRSPSGGLLAAHNGRGDGWARTARGPFVDTIATQMSGRASPALPLPFTGLEIDLIYTVVAGSVQGVALAPS